MPTIKYKPKPSIAKPIIPAYMAGYSLRSIPSKMKYPKPSKEAKVSAKNKMAMAVPNVIRNDVKICGRQAGKIKWQNICQLLAFSERMDCTLACGMLLAASRVTTTISLMASQFWKVRTVRRIIGSPSSSAITLSMPPIREALPAATITAPQYFSGRIFLAARVTSVIPIFYSSITSFL